MVSSVAARSPGDLFGLGPADRALVACARLQLDPPSASELRAALANGVALASLAQEAQRHGLTPLLDRHLQRFAATEIDATARADVHDEARRIGARSLALAAELGPLLASLRQAGVEALAVKGPVAALACYGDLGLRKFDDLDLVVDPASVAAAATCLQARGYTPEFQLSPEWLARFVEKSGSELLFFHADGRRIVDLHWSLMPRGYSFTPELEGVFLRRQTMRVGRAEVATLAVEPTLLFLLLHGAKHDWQCLGWLCDVAELLRRNPDLDWDAVLGWSAAPGRGRITNVGLAFAHALLGAPVPERVLRVGRADPAVSRISDSLARRLFSPRRAARSWVPTTIFSYRYLRSMARPADRLRFLHDVVLRPTPLEWQALPLPPALAPAHYLVRPIRLLGKRGRTLWHRARATVPVAAARAAVIGLPFNDHLKAFNALEVPVEATVVEQARALYRRHIAANLEAPSSLVRSENCAFYAAKPSWNSDIRWWSADDEPTFERFQRLFDVLRPTLERHGLGRRGIRMYCGFFITRSACADPDFHVDFTLESRRAGYTLMTPLDDWQGADGQLLYLDVFGRQRTYRYNQGTAIVFGSTFRHATAACADLPRAFLCFTFGTSEPAAWRQLEPTIGRQSRLLRKPDGSFRFVETPAAAVPRPRA